MPPNSFITQYDVGIFELFGHQKYIYLEIVNVYFEYFRAKCSFKSIWLIKD